MIGDCGWSDKYIHFLRHCAHISGNAYGNVSS